MPAKNNNTHKSFIIDTNVFIHNPESIYSFGDNNVVIPITVIEELDKFKGGSDKKGMHARQTLRNIDSYLRKGALKDKGVKIKSGGTLKIHINKTLLKPETGLSMNVKDNQILTTAVELKESGEEVFFISKDVNARVKAEALGIKARDYEKQKAEYSTLFKGWREVGLSAAEINELYKDGKMVFKNVSFLENEYAKIADTAGSNSSALCRFDHISKELVVLNDKIEAYGIRPLNMEQHFAFDLLLDDKVKLVTLVGQAGSGKTLIAIACGLARTIGRNATFEKLLVARPIMPLGKDIGYLPGSKDQKLNYWMRPIFDNLEFILSRGKFDAGKEGMEYAVGDKIDYLIRNNSLEIEALTYIRGRSIPGQYLIVDEAQNLTPHEIKTIVSRAGEGTKVILTGDPDQIDNPYLDSDSNGLTYIVERLKNQKIAGHILLSKSERSELATLAVEYL